MKYSFPEITAVEHENSSLNAYINRDMKDGYSKEMRFETA